LTGLEASGRINKKEFPMNRGHDDKYIQELLHKGVAYVNRAFISYAPEDCSKEQIEYTCEIIAEYLRTAYSEETYE
jgi:hypothetical protein